MKITFLAGQWKKTLKTLSPIASSNRTQESWKMLFVNPKTKMVTASNEKITIMGRVEMEVDSDSLTPFLVEAIKFSSVIATLKDDTKVTLKVEEDRVTFKSGRSVFKMKTLPEKTYARMEKPSEISQYLISSTFFKRAIDNTLDFIGGAGESRGALKGVHFVCNEQGEISMTATNGHFLSHINFTGAEVTLHAKNIGQKAILPPEFLRHAQRMSTESPKVMLYVSDKKVCVATPEQMVWSNVIDGKYPDVEQLLKVTDDCKHLTFKPDIESWQSSITRIKPLVDTKKLGKVVLSNDSGTMKMSVSSEVGENEEYVDGVSVGFKNNVSLSLNYLDAVLKNHIDVEVVMPEGNLKHIHFIGGDESFLSHQLISPMT